MKPTIGILGGTGHEGKGWRYAGLTPATRS